MSGLEMHTAYLNKSRQVPGGRRPSWYQDPPQGSRVTGLLHGLEMRNGYSTYPWYIHGAPVTRLCKSLICTYLPIIMKLPPLPLAIEAFSTGLSSKLPAVRVVATPSIVTSPVPPQ
jgi:hypothetical protein